MSGCGVICIDECRQRVGHVDVVVNVLQFQLCYAYFK